MAQTPTGEGVVTLRDASDRVCWRSRPRTGQWTQEPMHADVTVRGLHAVFDPALMIFDSDSRLFFYRYAERP